MYHQLTQPSVKLSILVVKTYRLGVKTVEHRTTWKCAQLYLNTSYLIFCKGNWALPRLTPGGMIWQWLWQLDLQLLTWQQDIFYSLAPTNVVGRIKGTQNKLSFGLISDSDNVERVSELLNSIYTFHLE